MIHQCVNTFEKIMKCGCLYPLFSCVQSSSQHQAHCKGMKAQMNQVIVIWEKGERSEDCAIDSNSKLPNRICHVIGVCRSVFYFDVILMKIAKFYYIKGMDRIKLLCDNNISSSFYICLVFDANHSNVKN
jgi:hypothetical protein